MKDKSIIAIIIVLALLMVLVYSSHAQQPPPAACPDFLTDTQTDYIAITESTGALDWQNLDDVREHYRYLLSIRNNWRRYDVPDVCLSLWELWMDFLNSDMTFTKAFIGLIESEQDMLEGFTADVVG